MKNSSKMLFSIILVMGTLMTVSSTSWLGSWMGLEINLLAFIPLMNNSKNLMSSESSLKYFLIQALASSVLLFSIIMYMMKTNLMSYMMNYNMPEMMMFSSLLMKSGAAPFHFWFPGVMEGLNWNNSLILMTWQKIAPLMLMSYILFTTLLKMVIILSIIIGSLGGLNQTSLRKLMAFSSINHIGWMMAGMYSMENLWLFYFCMYSFLSSTLIFMFNMKKNYYFNQLFNSMFESKILKFTLFLNLLSLGGLPPFMGFLPKWMVIQQLTNNSQMFLMTVMTVFTLITLFFYMRMCFSSFMINYYETNWMLKSHTNKMSMIVCMVLSSFSIMGLMIISMIYLIM